MLMVVVLDTFQSTPSVGRETDNSGEILKALEISIHSLRGEGDVCPSTCTSSLRHFNPLPPWGGRPYDKQLSKIMQQFQSTPSVGRETLCIIPQFVQFKEFQSTPSVGRETGLRMNPNQRQQFQSTPSVGRETKECPELFYTIPQFQSTPSVGRETPKRRYPMWISSFQSTPSVGRETLVLSMF